MIHILIYEDHQKDIDHLLLCLNNFFEKQSKIMKLIFVKTKKT